MLCVAYVCMQGMVQAAAYINKKIKDEQLLAPAFNSDPVPTIYYKSVICLLIARFLRRKQPARHCYFPTIMDGIKFAVCPFVCMYDCLSVCTDRISYETAERIGLKMCTGSEVCPGLCRF